MEYVSPFDEQVREPVAAPPRPASLEGATVALLDINKARGVEFLDRLETLLRARGAETFRTAKPTFSRPAPAEVIERIALHGDLAVEALAD
jgi:hypothetical protein